MLPMKVLLSVIRYRSRRTSRSDLAVHAKFYVLLSPCLCLISFLHLELYVLGDG